MTERKRADEIALSPLVQSFRGFGRDEAMALAGLALLWLLAVLWLFGGGGQAAMPENDMANMPDMSDMAMAGMAGIAPGPWTAERGMLTFAMWAIMMLAMMVPSAAPVILLQRRLARHYQGAVTAPPPASLLVLGYGIIWIGFAAAATVLQMALTQSGVLNSMGAVADRRIAGGLLVLACLYQLIPLKQNCLALCRSPVAFLMQHYRKGSAGAVRMGLSHGLYCLGCCWAAMALLFVGGVMNPVWIAGLAIFVLVEKALPFGRIAGLVLGAAGMIAGLAFILASSGG